MAVADYCISEKYVTLHYAWILVLMDYRGVPKILKKLYFGQKLINVLGTISDPVKYHIHIRVYYESASTSIIEQAMSVRQFVIRILQCLSALRES